MQSSTSNSSKCFLILVAAASVLIGQTRADDNNCLDDFIISPANANAMVLECCDRKNSKTIPDAIATLTNLIEIDLSKCSITGTIPSSANWDLLTELQTFNVETNALNGTLPEGIGGLEALLAFEASDNSLSGPIGVLTSLTSLEKLRVANNAFNSSIPSEFGLFSSLQSMDLSFNSLTGAIPQQLVNLTATITEFNLARNRFHKPLPDFGDLDVGYTANDARFYLAPGDVCELAKERCSWGSDKCNEKTQRCLDPDLGPPKEDDRAVRDLLLTFGVSCAGLGFLGFLILFIYKIMYIGGHSDNEEGYDAVIGPSGNRRVMSSPNPTFSSKSLADEL